MDEPRDTPDDAIGNSGGGAAAPDSGHDAERQFNSEAAPARQTFKRRHWGKLLLVTLVMLPVIVFAVWSAIALNWSYSDGVRPGFVQKVARKGYICKTWEGVLYNDLQGFRADSFQFTVRSDSLANVLQSLSGKQVSLEYQQHVGVPTSCFGDSEYFVTGVRELNK